MSIDQLLFLLILIALPLLERMIRAMRTRTNDSSTDASGTAADGRQTELTLPASAGPPALPPAVRHTGPEPLRPTEGDLHVRREGNRGPVSRLRTGGRSDSRRALAPAIGDGDLRRAIVMMAILGPCRAFEPQDASQSDR